MIKVTRNLDVEMGASSVRLQPRDAVRLGERLITQGVRAMARAEYQDARRDVRSRFAQGAESRKL